MTICNKNYKPKLCQKEEQRIYYEKKFFAIITTAKQFWEAKSRKKNKDYNIIM